MSEKKSNLAFWKEHVEVELIICIRLALLHKNLQ